ncbi:MAG: class I SAM-dependent methyltransferase [Bacillota bacterium]|nr:class I SAM-dependent methyltransferase [Bacillota bacterium]
MSYEKFAYLYDELMKDAPYHRWAEFVMAKLEQYGINNRSLLDLACGTGELSIRLSKEGFDVTGVDLSSDMLAVAMKKAEAEGCKIPFFQQDMSKLEGLGLFGTVGIFCDSLNYLKTEQEVFDTFVKVHNHLHEDGIFFFDVHSIFKVSQLFIDHTFTFNSDQLAYIWDSFAGEYPNSVEHELSFFVLDEKTEKYDRYDEVHFQRTYSVKQYTEWLESAGFELLEVSADFEDTQPNEESERIFFIAKRKNEKPSP